MTKMQRLPRGGNKTNYTLYMSVKDKQKISARAKELDMSEAFYVVNLASMDRELGLSEHLLSGGLIHLAPEQAVPEGIPEPVIEPQAEQIPVAPVQQVVQEPAIKPVPPGRPVIQRPPMKSIQDLLTASSGQPVLTTPLQQQLDQAQQDRLHQAMMKDQTGEAAMRKQILEDLPPEEKEDGEK